MSTSRTHKPGRDVSRSIPAALLTVWLLCFTIGSFWWMLDSRALFFALGSAGCLIVTIPLARQDYSLISPWTIVLLIVYVGCGIRGLAISAELDTSTRSLDELFLLGQDPEYFLGPSLLFVLALALLTVVYTIRPSEPRPTPAGHWLARYRFHKPVVALAVPLALVGLLAFVLFVQRTGGLDLSALSAKRTSIGGLELSEDYSRHGALVFLNNLSAVAFWIVSAHFATTRRRIGLSTSGGWLLAGFALNAVAMPVYVSSRTDAVFTLLTAFGIFLALRPGRFRMRFVVATGVLLLALLSVMTLLRVSESMGSQAEGTLTALSDSAADTLVYNRNFGDPEIASHVVRNVPAVIPFQNGKTIGVWAVAPVPRSLWPNKPLVNIGPTIGYYIYGNARSGVPPGLVGDLYLNFGQGGVLAGALIVGWALRLIDTWRLQHSLRADPAFALLYVPLAITFSKNVMNKGIGAAAYNSAIQAALTLLCLILVGTAARRTRHGKSN